MTRVRLVQFQRNTDEPMGITLKLNEEGMSLGTSVYYTYISIKQYGEGMYVMGITLKLNEEGTVCPWVRQFTTRT